MKATASTAPSWPSYQLCFTGPAHFLHCTKKVSKQSTSSHLRELLSKRLLDYTVKYKNKTCHGWGHVALCEVYSACKTTFWRSLTPFWRFVALSNGAITGVLGARTELSCVRKNSGTFLTKEGVTIAGLTTAGMTKWFLVCYELYLSFSLLWNGVDNEALYHIYAHLSASALFAAETCC